MFATKVFPQGERHDLKGGHFMAVLHLTKENFESEVLKSDKKVLVDFWATWCGPCQTMGPVVDELAQELTDVKVGKVNVDEQMALAREYKVMSIPTFLVFKDGKVAERTLGVQEKSELEQLIR